MDSHEAMQGDVVRGLIELILNSDDSYQRQAKVGKIWVGIDRAQKGKPAKLLVGDSAEGMSRAEIEQKLLPAGARASGHREGKAVRGLHGRGAKDVAVFGSALFESIKDGEFATVRIQSNPGYSNLSNRPAQAADYERLRLSPGASGTLVTIFVERERFSIPRQANLANKLAKHFQLRDLLRRSGSELWLEDHGAGSAPERLSYQNPPGKALAAVNLDISGYPQAKTRLELVRVDQKLEEDRTEQRMGGILVCGEQAVYEVGYFGLEGRSGALYYTGRLRLPYIDELQRAYDDAEERRESLGAHNPIPIITRRRDGLAHNHPFYLALKMAIDRQLKPLVEREEAGEAERKGELSADTHKRLREATSKLGKLFREIEKEEELEQEPGGRDDGAGPSPLTGIPEQVRLLPGAEKVVSLRADQETFDPEEWPEMPVVRVRVTEPDVATVSSAEVVLAEDPNRAGRWRGTVTVIAGTLIDATALELSLGPQAASVIVEVVDEEKKKETAPERLSFDVESATVKVGGKRKVRLRAPAGPADGPGNVEVRGVVGVVKASAAEGWTEVTQDDERWHEIGVELEGEAVGQGRVRAEVGEAMASLRVQVRTDEGDLPFDIDIQPRAPEYASFGRAEFTPIKGVKTIVVLAHHPSLKRYFGPEMKNQGSITCQVLVAEVVADRLATEMLFRKETKLGRGLFSDYHAYNSEYRKYFARFLAVSHEALVNFKEEK